MEALRRSVGQEQASKPGPKKPKKAAAGQKEMLLPIAGKKPAKEAGAKKPAPKPQRKSA
jgi:DNA end-binding protein Ku